MTYETALAATKIISALLTAGLGVLTVYLETKEGNKKLTHKGRISAVGAMLMLLVSIVSTTIDSKNNQSRTEATARENIKKIEDQNTVINKLSSIIEGISKQNDQIKSSINKQDIAINGIKRISNNTNLHTGMIREQIDQQNKSLYQIRRNSLPLGDLSVSIDFSIPANSNLISHAIEKWTKEIDEFSRTVPREKQHGILNIKDNDTTIYFGNDKDDIWPSLGFNRKSFMYKDVDIIMPIVNPLSPEFNIAIIDNEQVINEIQSVFEIGPNKPFLRKTLLTLFCPTLIQDSVYYTYSPRWKDKGVHGSVNFKNVTKLYETENASSLLDLPGKYVLITSSLYVGNGSIDRIALSFRDKQSFSYGRLVELKKYKQFYINNNLCALYRFTKEDFQILNQSPTIGTTGP